MDIKDQLQHIFREVFEEPQLEITSEMTANDVAKWTSLTHMIMIEKTERHFNIKLTLKELIKLKKAGDLLSLIENKLQG